MLSVESKVPLPAFLDWILISESIPEIVISPFAGTTVLGRWLQNESAIEGRCRKQQGKGAHRFEPANLKTNAMKHERKACIPKNFER